MGFDEAIGSGAAEIIRVYGLAGFIIIIQFAAIITLFLFNRQDGKDHAAAMAKKDDEIKAEIKAGREIAETYRRDFATAIETLRLAPPRATRSR